MVVAIYPGSFDPITLGHYDIIKRAAKIVDKLIIGVLNNTSKTPMFTVDERIQMIKKSVKDIDNVSIVEFDGLLVDFTYKMNANLIIRGLRAVSDFEYELQMAQTNKKLYNEVETVFMATNVKYSYISSSLVKEISKFHGDVSPFVPEPVLKYLNKKQG